MNNTIACQYKQLDKSTLVELIEKFDTVYIYCNGAFINDYTDIIKEAVIKYGVDKVINTVKLKAVWNNYEKLEHETLKKNAYNIAAGLEFEKYQGNKLK